jgi:opacity protein-like surface antigen
MRRKLFVFSTVLVCIAPATAGAQGTDNTIQGFGGMTFGTSSIVGTSASSTFGGRITTGLTSNIEVIGEAGRMSDIKPPLLDLLDFTPVDLHVSAWYGEGGIRFITSSRSAVRPYAEATAGFARLSTDLSGITGAAGAVIDAGLAFLNRTEPLLGAGGGVVVQGGPVSIDMGYRYKKILAGGVASALNSGNPYQVNQVRVGLGFRF